MTSGDYSDYGIDAVFIDKESAEIFCATKNTIRNLWSDYKVEEYPIGVVEGSKDYKKLVDARINKTSGKVEISWLWSYENMIPEVHEDFFHTEYQVKFTAKKDATETEIEKMVRDIVAQWKYEHGAEGR